MAIIGLSSSASGLSALSMELDVIANNLANINTTGFKGSRLNFQDLMYVEKKQAGVENTNGDQRPMGLSVGLGVEASGTHKNFAPGPAQATGKPLDVMIEGIGFFQVSVENDLSSSGTAYTRAGNFAMNSEGELVLATDTGRVVEPAITIPEGAQNITISNSGVVSVMPAGGDELEEVGQFELAAFINPAGLKEVGENLFITTDASGDPVTANPGTDGVGQLNPGFLEGSNVEPVKEL